MFIRLGFFYLFLLSIVSMVKSYVGFRQGQHSLPEPLSHVGVKTLDASYPHDDLLEEEDAKGRRQQTEGDVYDIVVTAVNRREHYAYRDHCEQRAP